MSAISETYNRTHNILELEDVLTKCFFHSKWNGTWLLLVKIDNKYELTDELANDVRLKKISEINGFKV